VAMAPKLLKPFRITVGIKILPGYLVIVKPTTTRVQGVSRLCIARLSTAPRPHFSVCALRRKLRRVPIVEAVTLKIIPSFTLTFPPGIRLPMGFACGPSSYPTVKRMFSPVGGLRGAV
jgi:hypothetical protein